MFAKVLVPATVIDAIIDSTAESIPLFTPISGKVYIHQDFMGMVCRRRKEFNDRQETMEVRTAVRNNIATVELLNAARFVNVICYYCMRNFIYNNCYFECL